MTNLFLKHYRKSLRMRKMLISLNKMVKNLNCINLIVFIVISFFSHTDRIYLTNGQNSKTTIIDTTGCSVTIKRNEKNVSIKK